ncbi:hypothetical protein [Elioraea rosea]|uniref:hypothetical protein n=1 Tax=Elioraea rosea TaxID=2492390 RepID=UPI001183F443|nr:hypothetical protein [Elioraea rosea]
MPGGPLFHAWSVGSLRRLGFTGPWIRVSLEPDALVLLGEGGVMRRIALTDITAMAASVVSGRHVWHAIWLTLGGAPGRLEITTPPSLEERVGYEAVVRGLAEALMARGVPVTTGHGWFGAVFGLGALGLVAAGLVVFSIVLAVEEDGSWWHPLPALAFILTMIALLWRTLTRETPRPARSAADLSRAFAWRR